MMNEYTLKSVLNIAVCDDSNELLQMTVSCIDTHLKDIPHRIYTYTSYDDFSPDFSEHPFSIAVLDIRMPGKNGIELAKELLRRSPGCQIIFLSSHIGYAEDVYDVEHISFILKEHMEERLPAVLQKAIQKLSVKDIYLQVAHKGEINLINVSDIQYIERNLHKTLIYTDTAVYTCAEKIEALMERLPSEQFCQCHKSYAVNWNYVQHFDKTAVTLHNSRSISISRQRYTSTYTSFQNYLQLLSRNF